MVSRHYDRISSFRTFLQFADALYVDERDSARRDEQVDARTRRRAPVDAEREYQLVHSTSQ